MLYLTKFYRMVTVNKSLKSILKNPIFERIRLYTSYCTIYVVHCTSYCTAYCTLHCTLYCTLYVISSMMSTMA